MIYTAARTDSSSWRIQLVSGTPPKGFESERELGAMAVAINRAVGPLLHWAATRNARRHPSGRRLEPRTFIDRHA